MHERHRLNSHDYLTVQATTPHLVAGMWVMITAYTKAVLPAASHNDVSRLADWVGSAYIPPVWFAAALRFRSATKNTWTAATQELCNAYRGAQPDYSCRADAGM